MNKLKKILKTLQSKGLRGIAHKLTGQPNSERQARIYQQWIYEYDTLTDNDRKLIRKKIESFSHKPLISIVMPVYNIEEKWLRRCLESVLNQIYTNWELCIADDCSSKPHIKRVLDEYAAKDSRIKVIFRPENGHISAASNSALQLATGEFTAFLDHDDELSEHALYFIVEEINQFPEVRMIYSDEDMISENGSRYEPKFKPDFSLDLLYSLNFVTHLAIYRTDILRKIGGFQIGFEGSQDYDLALRFIEEISEKNIRHIPHILYHWRAIPGSVALSADQKDYAHSRARQIIKEHLERQKTKAQVVEGFANWHRVIYDLPKKISVSVISTQKLNTNFENSEFISVENISAESFNSAAKKAKGDVLIFIESSIKPHSSNWIKELTSFAIQKRVGVVGGKIFFADKTVRNNGIILGINEIIGFAFRKLPNTIFSGLARTHVISNFSAVSGVLAFRREVFESAGGFDEVNFNQGLFDVDFCLRLREKNYRIIFTPYAEFMQTEDSLTEKVLQDKNSAEIRFFRAKWKKLIEKDEFYNPNFSLKNGNFEIALPPRIKKPWND